MAVVGATGRAPSWDEFQRSHRPVAPTESAGPSPWRRLRADPSRFFTERELARARAYQRPLRWLRPLRAAAAAAVVLAFVFGATGPRVIRGWGVHGWAWQVLAVMVAIELCLLVVDPVLDGWVDLVHDRRWGLSTHTGGGFVADLVKGFVFGLVVNALLLVPLYWVLRSVDWWWLVGWLVVVAASAVFGFLFPVVAAPLFNRFTPLPPGPLADRIAEVVRAAGLPMVGVFVADESRRSRRDNAYVAGFGATRRLVVFDTLLAHPPELVAQVVAHELGHWRRRHVVWQLGVLAVCTLGVFGLLRAVAAWPWLLHQAGVSSLAQPGSLPVVLVAAQVGFGLTGVVNAWVSRAFERQADLDALELIGDPVSACAMLRRLHVKNLADLDPGPLQRLTASHPPAAERMALVEAWAAARGVTLDHPRFCGSARRDERAPEPQNGQCSGRQGGA